MAALNFPTENLQAGVTEYSANGTTYLWDGVKWVGRTAGGAAGTNSIQNNGFTVQVNADGDLVLPAFSLPNTAGTTGQVLKWPSSGTTLDWANDNNSGTNYTLPAATTNVLGGVKLGEGFVLNGSNQVTTSKLYSTNLTQPNQHYRLELDTNGVVVLPDQSIINGSTLRGVYGTGEANFTGITIGPDADHREESWVWVDANGAHVAARYSGDISAAKQWDFNNNGTMYIPQGGDIQRYDGESYVSVLGGGTGSLNADVVSTDYYRIVDWSIGEGYLITVAGQAANELAPASSRHGYISYYGNGIYLDVVSYSYDAERNETEIQLSGLNDADYTGATFRVVSRLSNFTTITGEDGSLQIENGNLYVTKSSKIEAKKSYDNEWGMPNGTVFSTQVGGYEISIQIAPNQDLYLRGLLNRLYNHFDSPSTFYYNYQNIRVRINPNTNNILANVTNIIQPNNYPPRYIITVDAAPPGGSLAVDSITFQYDFVNTAGFDIGDDSFGMATDDDDITFRSGRDIELFADDDIRISGGSVFEMTLRKEDYQDPNDGIRIRTSDEGTDKDWLFQFDGNLTLPADGNINFANGVNILSTVTGGGNGIANRVQFDNGGSISQVADEAPGRYNIVIDAEKDIIFNTDEDSQQFRFTSTGNLQLPQGSTISDQPNSVDITVGRVSESPYWYNLFGDTGATITANAATNGSVCYDTGGNVYVLGSTQRGGSLESDNLFLKYSPTGQLLWRRTWTDNNGMDCGSYNASMRYVAANVDLGTQDTILWAAQIPWNYTSYIGTMDTDGNLVDQYGTPRLPTRLDNFAVTDLEWSGNVPMISDSMVAVVGQHYLSGPGYHFPTVGGVDLDNAAVVGDTTVMPDGTDLNVGLLSGTPWANMYKAIAVFPNSIAAAVVGSYYDGSWSHAMISISDNGPPVTYSIGAEFNNNHVIGEDVCCDANGNVYVIVNNITSGYAVLVKTTRVGLDTGISSWQLLLGPNGLSSNEFYASSVVYDNGFVYVLGQFYDADTDQSDTMLIKVNVYNGNIVWSRRIGTPGDDGINAYGPPGWSSSSGISVYDDLIVISFATADRTPGFNMGPEANTVTLQYPMDGSVLGEFGDFEITDFDPGHAPAGYEIVTLTTALGSDNIQSAFASLQATTVTVGTGWTNTQWDIEQNREVYDPQTWRFNYDGSLDTKEITHLSEVKVTAKTASNTDNATWGFQDNKGLRFPDGSVQYGAYVETETALDGGSAVTVFNIVPRPIIADGGGSSSRFGVNDPVYDGSSGNDYVLDGGGA